MWKKKKDTCSGMVIIEGNVHSDKNSNLRKDSLYFTFGKCMNPSILLRYYKQA